MIDLKRKVGPLPVWGYGAIAAAGTAFFLWRRKQSASASTAAVAPSTDPIDPNTGMPYSQENTGTPSTLGGSGSTSYTQNNYANPAQTPANGGTGAGLDPHQLHVLHDANKGIHSGLRAPAVPVLDAHQLAVLHRQHTGAAAPSAKNFPDNNPTDLRSPKTTGAAAPSAKNFPDNNPTDLRNPKGVGKP